MKTLGQIGYEKFCKLATRDGLEAESERVPWEDIPEISRKHWDEIAEHIAKSHDERAWNVAPVSE